MRQSTTVNEKTLNQTNKQKRSTFQIPTALKKRLGCRLCSHAGPLRWPLRAAGEALAGRSERAPSFVTSARLSGQPERRATAASMALHRPIKGILKNKSSAASSVVSSAEQPSGNADEELSKKSLRWDEMNILATYHPADKDYGLMKIDEPSTPYHSMIGDDDDETLSDSEATEAMTPDVLAKKLSAAEGFEPKYRIQEKESSEEEEQVLSPEEQEKKRQFEKKRKMYYNEGLDIKLARQLISKDLHDEDDEAEEMPETTDGEKINTEDSNQGSTTTDQLQNKS
ncbi:PREDICTED: protein phosphatase inhibitor 2-like [Elephantulus edwardii]|uniref:protein phosphatase inhibitor 2-like n=1 Tax=Elephantulus edwardii TaxID=28737 RepID=UPI0003F0C39F|nr:PREDICTED: protein phosphatase inhibitor 2-like [Elephantulus edwardii]